MNDGTAVALRRARRRSVALAIVLLCVAVALAVPLVVSRRHPWFQAFDDAWRVWTVDHLVDVATGVARVLSVIGSAYVTLPLRLAVAGAAVLAVRRRWVQFSAFAVAIISSEIVVGVLKAAIDRPRPRGGIVATVGASFPSGHAIAHLGHRLRRGGGVAAPRSPTVALVRRRHVPGRVDVLVAHLPLGAPGRPTRSRVRASAWRSRCSARRSSTSAVDHREGA